MEATFYFVDLAGFSALTETHGDDAGADLAQRFAAMAQSPLRDDGRLVDTVGDAVFLSSETRLWREAEATPNFPAVRADIHNGDAVLRDGRWFGTSVNIAACLAALASGGPRPSPSDSGGAIDPVCRMRVRPETCAGHLRFEESDFWFCSRVELGRDLGIANSFGFCGDEGAASRETGTPCRHACRRRRHIALPSISVDTTLARSQVR